MDRRDFLRVAGIAVVAIPAAELLASCGTSPAKTPLTQGHADGGTKAPGLTFTSSVVHGHTHQVTLEVATLDAPPAAGITKDTTVTAGHFHQVTLTSAQLEAIKNGQTVTQDTTVVYGHKHTFAFVDR